MWKSKKLIIIAIITVVVLGGVLGGVAIANADSSTTTTNSPVSGNISTLLNKIATIYQQKTGQTLDTQALTDAFQQAQKDIRSEALDNYLNNLVTKGKITSEQARQYKDWVNSKPDVPIGPGPNGGRFFGKLGGRIGGTFGGWFHIRQGPGVANQ